MVGALQSDISDADLHGIVESFVQAHPTYGQRLFIGHLRSLNLHVQCRRVRESLLRVDPHSVALGHRQTLHQRHYSVPGPNSLWHIDGYHKLIHWKIIIHGGIDGFSREIVYLSASDNNCSTTVLKDFLKAVE